MYKKTKLTLLIIAIVIGSVFINPLFSINSFAETSSMVTVKGSILTNDTTMVVGNPLEFNTGTSYNVSSSADFVATLATALGNCEPTITINYTGSSVGTLNTYLTNAIHQARQTPGNDYEKTLLYQWSFSYTPTAPNFTATYTFSYLEDATKRQAVANKVTEILGSIITVGMTDEQKEKAINDYIVLNLAYDTTLREHTAYAAVLGNGKTVCQGYALLAYKMLTSAGFEARIITGKGNNVAHAWNLVKVGGVWYHLDCTWNDPVPDVPGRVSYRYFNLSDSQMRNNLHTWTAEYYETAPSAYTAADQSIRDQYANVYSSTPSAITVTNNFKIADTVKVEGISAGDKVKVYNQSSLGKLLGSASVIGSASEAIIKISQLGTGEGKVYVTVTSPNKMESSRVEASFQEEPTTDTITSSAITVSNNARAIDTVKVDGLRPGDTVKIYDTSTLGKLLKTAIVGKTTSSAALTINIPNETTGGSIYLTLTSTGKKESARSQVNYNSATVTNAPDESKVLVINNPGSDLIVVYGLSAGDIVKIYDAASNGNLLKTSTVAAKQSQSVISIKENQLKSEGGDIHISVISKNKLESSRTKVTYSAE